MHSLPGMGVQDFLRHKLDSSLRNPRKRPGMYDMCLSALGQVTVTSCFELVQPPWLRGQCLSMMQ